MKQIRMREWKPGKRIWKEKETKPKEKKKKQEEEEVEVEKENAAKRYILNTSAGIFLRSTVVSKWEYL